MRHCQDHAAAATQRIQDQAYYEAQEAAAAYDYVQASLTNVITQARDLLAQIHNGMVPENDARELLADLRNQAKPRGNLSMWARRMRELARD